MNFKDLFNKYELKDIKLNMKFASLEFKPNTDDKDAAWELYVELITRIVTQHLKWEDGDEKTALDSIYSLFPTTRDILKRRGRKCIEFSKIAVIVLNQIIRPFTAKWHRKELEGAFDNEKNCIVFRKELEVLQEDLRKYVKLLAGIAEVEDITCLSDVDDR